MSAQAANSDFDILSSAWLAEVSEDSRHALRGIGETVAYSDKDVVYGHEGEQNWLWGVIRGAVRVQVAMNEMEPVLGHIHQAGAWFGESEVILGTPGLVEMRAVGEAFVYRMPFARFRRLANERVELWGALARLTSMNQLLAMSAANDLALRTGRKRLAAVLLRLSGQRGVIQGSAQVSTVMASQQEIAGLSNLSLSKISAYLGGFSSDGLVDLKYGRVVVCDPQGLLDIIEE